MAIVACSITTRVRYYSSDLITNTCIFCKIEWLIDKSSTLNAQPVGATNFYLREALIMNAIIVQMLVMHVTLTTIFDRYLQSGMYMHQLDLRNV